MLSIFQPQFYSSFTRNRRIEDGGLRTEDRSQRLEARSQKPEARSQRSEGGSQRFATANPSVGGAEGRKRPQIPGWSNER